MQPLPKHGVWDSQWYPSPIAAGTHDGEQQKTLPNTSDCSLTLDSIFLSVLIPPHGISLRTSPSPFRA